MPDVELVEIEEEDLSTRCTEYVSFEDDGFWQSRTAKDETTYIVWREHFEFLILPGAQRILWRRLAQVADEVFFTYFLGQVLSYYLLFRGFEPLHATAVLVGTEAVAFLGDSGSGKSTLAAAFIKQGYPLLTDDVLVLECREHDVVAKPSLPRIKLSQEAASRFFEGQQAVPMNSFTSKMIFLLKSSQYASRELRLRKIYVLPEAHQNERRTGITILSGQEAFLPLIKNTFNNALLHRERIKRQFAFAAQLVRSVSVRELSYAKGLPMLPQVVNMVVGDLLRESNSD